MPVHVHTADGWKEATPSVRTDAGWQEVDVVHLQTADGLKTVVFAQPEPFTASVYPTTVFSPSRAQSNTPYVTVTASGDDPKSYRWYLQEDQGHSTAIAPNNPTSRQTSFRLTRAVSSNQQAGFFCDVTNLRTGQVATVFAGIGFAGRN